MNENLNLVEILKDCPKGTKLWSPPFGDVRFNNAHQNNVDYAISIIDKYGKEKTFTSKGLYLDKYEGECVLFPSKEQMDWSKFKVPVEKFDYSTLKPFDKVLVRANNSSIWKCTLFTCMRDRYMTAAYDWNQGIPYNDETKHLAGTTDMPDEKYIWWEE